MAGDPRQFELPIAPCFDVAALEVRRTARRKTISIEVADGGVRVLAPRWVAAREIRELVEERRPWIEARLQELADRPPAARCRYTTGDTLSYLGATIRLDVRRGARRRPQLVDDRLLVSVPAGRAAHAAGHAVRHQVEWWYRDQALAYLTAETRAQAARLNRPVASVALRSYKARWGSCSEAGEITYDWRLIMAPEPVVRYVVAHEVAHLVRLDHSPRFWRQVRNLCPDFKASCEWLRRYGEGLMLPDLEPE